MPLVSKTANKCGIEECSNVAVRTLPETSSRVCQKHFDIDASVIGHEDQESYESVLEESPDLVGESAMDRGEDKMTHSLMDDERQSERLQGAKAILGDLFAPTKPT